VIQKVTGATDIWRRPDMNSDLLAYRPLLHREWPVRWGSESNLAVEPKANPLDGGDLRRWQARLHGSGTQIAT
jgi:hypothetical protein